MIRSHGIDKDEAERMLNDDEPQVKLTFDEKARKHTWRYFPKKDWTEPPEMEEMVKFGDFEPEVQPEVEPEVQPDENSDESSSDDEESPEITCKPSKTKSILKPGPSGLGRKRNRN